MIPVSALYTECEKMLRDKWGYIWGTAGIRWTQARQDATENDMAKKYGKRWIGHMVADCSGVMVYIWRQHNMSIYHGSNTIARKYCGEMQGTPAPGYAAFKWKKKDTSKFPDGRGDFYHIGIVSADGQNVYESRGTQTGFVLSAASGWHSFAPFNDVAYEPQEAISVEPYRAVVKVEQGTLNMRAGAGTNYPVIFKLPNGTPLTVLVEYPNGWAFVDDDGTQGYVSMKYLERVDEEPPAEEPEYKWGVFIPCDNEQEARRYAGNIKNAVVIRRN